MGFYGNMSDSNRSTLQFDKIYANKAEMDRAANSDGVFVGRYVLVDYDYGDNGYSNNFNQDNGASVNKGRGWDSTVWKKVYQNGVLTYIMIAELNAVVPTLTQTTLAPSANGASVGFTPVTNVEYNLAIKAPWGMSIGDIDFNAAGFVKEIKTVESGNNTISVTPISSGTLYNGVRENDTYQLNINLPGIGNTISDVWDLIYGVDRNTEIRWGYTTGHRAITINNGSITYNPAEMNTVAGIINSVHDLIGMNVEQLTELPTSANSWDNNKIYFVPNNGFYYKDKKYDNGTLTSDFIPKLMPELGTGLNTIHGLLLAINKKLDSGNQYTLDDTTVQGAINALNKKRKELQGVINSGNSWIESTVENGITTISHKTQTVPAVSVDDAAKYSYYPTVDGAGHVTAINRKEITLSALGIDGLSERVSSNENAITTIQGKIGQVGNTNLQTQVDDINEKIGSSDDTVEDDTIYGAIKNINSTISEEVTEQLSEVTSLIREYPDNNENKIVIGKASEADRGITIDNNGALAISTLGWNNDNLIAADQLLKINIDDTDSTAFLTDSSDNNILSFSLQGEEGFAFGGDNSATGWASFAEGFSTTASGHYSHAEGSQSVAEGLGSHAEGSGNAIGDYSHAEGYITTAEGIAAHVEGSQTTVQGSYAHGEGFQNIANGEAAHAEGNSTQALGNYSHAQNLGTVAGIEAQTVIGKYNKIEDENTTKPSALIIGKGTDNNHRRNALTVDWDGNVTCGKITSSTITDIEEDVVDAKARLNSIEYNLNMFGLRLDKLIDNSANASNKQLIEGTQFSDYDWLMLCGTTDNANRELGFDIRTTQLIPTALFAMQSKFYIAARHNQSATKLISVIYVDNTHVTIADKDNLNLTIFGLKLSK